MRVLKYKGGDNKMRIVFLNSLEKSSGGELVKEAHVWIGEEEGTWRLGWNEITLDVEEETIWYDGDSWSEMLHVYRHHLAVKLGDGFHPIIEGVFHEKESARNETAQKLICFSELNSNEELYQELCIWRRKKAAVDRKAPYLIASNRLLRLISVFQPKTLEELLQLPGVGENKSSQYGTELLALTEQSEREHEFPLHWVEQALDEELYRAWQYKQKELKYKHEMEKYTLSRELLMSISKGFSIEELCKRMDLDRRETVVLLEQLEKEGNNTDALLNIELQEMPQEEQSAVWQAYEEMGDTYLKPVLQRVYGTDILAEGNLEQMYERLRLVRIRYRRQLSRVRTAG